MIIVSYIKEKSYLGNADPSIDHVEFDQRIDIVGIINDAINVYDQSEMYRIMDCIDNDPDFNPEVDCFYELYLRRAQIDSDPVPEEAFCIDNVVKKHYQDGQISDPIIRL